MEEAKDAVQSILKSKQVAVFVACLIVDNACSYALSSMFEDSSTLALCVVRSLMVPLLLYFASKYGHADFHLSKINGKKDLKLVSSSSSESKSKGDSEEGTEEDEIQATNIANKYKKGALGITYIILSISMMFTGMKCATLNFVNGNTLILQQISMIGLVLALNAQLYLCASVVSHFRKAESLLLPQVHPHPLHRVDEAASYYRCEACDSALDCPYACTSCNFYICKSCSMKDIDSLEGLLRNDKGIVKSDPITYKDYFTMCYGYLKHQLPLVYGAVITLFISGVANMLVPNLQGEIMDSIVKLDLQEFYRASLLFVIMQFAVGLVSALETYFFQLLNQRLLCAAKIHLFQNIQHQDMAFFDGMYAKITNMMSFKIEKMFAPLSQHLSRFVLNIVLLVGGITFCMNISWKLTAMAFSVMGPINFFIKIFSEYTANTIGHSWDLSTKSVIILTEFLSNTKTVRSFAQEANQEAKYRNSQNESLASEQKTARIYLWSDIITNNSANVLTVLILWYGGSLVLDSSNALSIGSLTKFQLYWGLFKTSFDNITETTLKFEQSMGEASYPMQIFACKPAIETSGGDTCTSIGDMSLKNVSFYYQMSPSQIVLKQLNLDIKRGQVVALVGKSGSGKTTIINLLQRFYDPTEGTIFLNGADLKSFNPTSYRSLIGTVAQDTQLLSESFYDNITFFNKNYTMEQVIEAAKQANAHDFIMESPMGYDTKVGREGSRISGGQKQRIALARAFLRQPSLLLLDEATSSLDAESETLVQEAIDKLIAGRMCTVVLVAHRLSTVVGADLIAVVESGSIVERGTHSKLMASGGIYASMVEKQIKKFKNIIVEEEQDVI